MKKVILLIAVTVLTISLAACGGRTEAQFDTTKDINVYTRDTESGTREAFFKGISFGDAADDDSFLVAGKTVVTGNGDMINKVISDEYGLGYISLSSLSDNLKGLNFEGVEPSETNVLNNSYGLKRPFMYMIRENYNDTTVEKIVEALVAYMGTVEGKAIIMDNGGIVESVSGDQTWNDIKGNYADVCGDNIDNSSVKVYIGGSTSVEKIAKAMTADFKGKCGDFDPQHNHQGSSAAYKGTQKADTSTSAATYLDLGFASRTFKAEETGATATFGQICWDAVVAVVNTANTTLTNISVEQLRNAFDKDGNIKTWDDLSE